MRFLAAVLCLTWVGLSGCGSISPPPPSCGTSPCPGDPPSQSIEAPGGPWTATVDASEGHTPVARFEFFAEPEHNYLFTCTPGTLKGCSVRVQDGLTGKVLLSAASDDGTPVSVIPWAGLGNTWLIEVSAFDGASGGTFSYALKDLGADDYPLARELLPERTPSPQSFPMRVDAPGDADTFFISAQARHTYHVLCIPSSYTQSTWNLVVREEDGRVLVNHVFVPQPPGQPPPLEFTVDPPRRLFLTLETPSTSTVESYACTFTDEGPDEVGDTLEQATALTLGSPFSGGIQRLLDADVFTAPLQSGHYYRLTCSGRTLPPWHITARTPAGAVMNEVTPFGEFRVVESGTYSFTVDGDDSDTGQRMLGAYTLLLEDLGPDDHGDTVASATPLTPSTEPVLGSLQSYLDRDVFSFSSTGGHIYRFECDWDSVGQRFTVAITDAQGGALELSPLGRQEVRVEAPGSGGLLFIQLTSYFQREGAYTCHLEDLGLDDYGDTQATATVLQPSPTVTVKGNKDTPSDLDVFAFTATAGQRYHLTCDNGFATQSDCSTNVKDASGTLRGYNRTGDWYFTPSSSGTYFIEVSHSLPWGPYVFQLTQETP